jgi:hypothetical protein
MIKVYRERQKGDSRKVQESPRKESVIDKGKRSGTQIGFV